MSVEDKQQPAGPGTVTVEITYDHIIQASLATHRERETFQRRIAEPDVIYRDADSFVTREPE